MKIAVAKDCGFANKEGGISRREGLMKGSSRIMFSCFDHLEWEAKRGMRNLKGLPESCQSSQRIATGTQELLRRKHGSLSNPRARTSMVGVSFLIQQNNERRLIIKDTMPLHQTRGKDSNRPRLQNRASKSSPAKQS